MSLVNKMLKDLSDRERTASDVMRGINVQGPGTGSRGWLGRLLLLAVIVVVAVGAMWWVYGPKQQPIPQPRASLQAAAQAISEQPAAQVVAPSAPDNAATEVAAGRSAPLHEDVAKVPTRSGLTIEEAFAAGREAEARGDRVLADRRYSDVLLADPTVNEVREALVTLRMEDGRLTDARRVLNRGFELDATHPAFSALNEQLKKREALAVARTATPASATVPTATSASAEPVGVERDLSPAEAEKLATQLLQAGDPNEAARLVARTAASHPGWKGARVLAARIELAREQPAAALALLEGDAPGASDPESRGLMASAYQRLGRHEEASRAYRTLLNAQPEEGRWWVGYAISREALGDRVGALQAYTESLRRGTLDHRVRTYVTGRVDVLRDGG